MGTKLTTTKNDQPTNDINRLRNQFMAESEFESSSHKYCSESERLKTFKNWRNRDINPKILTKAGFYYTGQLDITKCFHCNIEIYRW